MSGDESEAVAVVSKKRVHEEDEDEVVKKAPRKEDSDEESEKEEEEEEKKPKKKKSSDTPVPRQKPKSHSKKKEKEKEEKRKKVVNDDDDDDNEIDCAYLTDNLGKKRKQRNDSKRIANNKRIHESRRENVSTVKMILMNSETAYQGLMGLKAVEESKETSEMCKEFQKDPEADIFKFSKKLIAHAEDVVRTHNSVTASLRTANNSLVLRLDDITNNSKSKEDFEERMKRLMKCWDKNADSRTFSNKKVSPDWCKKYDEKYLSSSSNSKPLDAGEKKKKKKNKEK